MSTPSGGGPSGGRDTPPHEDGRGPEDRPARGSARDALRRLRRPTAFTAVASLLTALAESLGTAGLAVVLTGAEPPGRLAFLAEVPAVAGLVALSLVGNLAVAAIRDALVARWVAERRMDLATRFSRLPPDRQSGYSPAEMVVRAEQVGAASSAVNQYMTLSANLLRTAVYLVAALVASWTVALAAAVLGGGMVLALRTLTRRTRRMNRQLAEGYVDAGGELGALVEGARELHQLGRWETNLGRFDGRLDRLRAVSTRSRIMADMVSPTYYVGMMFIGLGIGAWIDRTGTATTAQLATSGLLLIRALGGAQGSQTAYQAYQDQLPYLERLLDFLDGLSAGAHRGHVDHLPDGPDTLAAEGLHLSHRGDTVVHDVRLHLEGPGGVAIVGPSGAGKTTLLHGLAGMVHPDAGSVRVGGVATTDCTPDLLSRTIGLSPQHPRTIPGTVRENLVRADRDMADADIHRVLESLGLGPTVASFGDGLDSRLDRDAAGFSGGELQRIGLARLLLADPAIWLLDEPTSALDAASAALVQTIVAGATENHLVVLVTHRPELVALCGHLVLVVDGRVVDEGPPAEVATRRTFVAQMVNGVTPADRPR